jgi:hypothetical protein
MSEDEGMVVELSAAAHLEAENGCTAEIERQEGRRLDGIDVTIQRTSELTATAPPSASSCTARPTAVRSTASRRRESVQRRLVHAHLTDGSLDRTR